MNYSPGYWPQHICLQQEKEQQRISWLQLWPTAQGTFGGISARLKTGCTCFFLGQCFWQIRIDVKNMSQDEFLHCGSVFLLFPYNSTDICIRKWVYNTVGNITNCCSQCFSRKIICANKTRHNCKSAEFSILCGILIPWGGS